MPIKTISKELVLEISRGYPDLKLLNLSNNEISVVEMEEDKHLSLIKNKNFQQNLLRLKVQLIIQVILELGLMEDGLLADIL